MNAWAIKRADDFEAMAVNIAEMLLRAPQVDVGSWQSQDVKSRPEMLSYELRHAHMSMVIPRREDQLATMTGCNLPWAEDHFLERVGGDPLNPPPSEQYWPYAVQGNAAHKQGEKFSHTYPERFWPKEAGDEAYGLYGAPLIPHSGIRYAYGDLNDVVDLLRRDPHTRQAYLPVWFPEDTGACEGQRVPCTLGYHFLQRQGKVDIEYHIRSCDYMRHWRDDVYMAGRLLQWVSSRMGESNSTTRYSPGQLVMNIGSFHIFEGDRVPLSAWVKKMKPQIAAQQSTRLSSAL